MSDSIIQLFDGGNGILIRLNNGTFRGFLAMLDWQNIDTVLLDMDGTLLDLHYDNYFWNEHVPQEYAKANNIDVADALQQLTPLFMQNQGTLNWYCTDYWSDKLAMNIIALKQELNHLINIRPDVEKFLTSVKKAGKQVAIITNAHQDVLDLKMQHTGISGYFDKIFTSHQFGAAKEQAVFWDKLQKAFPFDKSRTAFFDDSLAVLESAKHYGIEHIVAMRHPDSKKPVRDIDNFSAIIHFNEVMPV